MLVGFTGVPGAGKTFSAKILSDNLVRLSNKNNIKCVVYNNGFSDPIKKIANLLFPDWEDKHIRGELKDTVDPNHNISPRKVQQIIGKSLMEINDKIWIEYLFRQLDHHNIDHTKPNNIVTIDDVRFPHDFQSIINRGGIMVGIVPGKKPGINISEEAKMYETEKYTSLLTEDCDYTFVNNYDLQHEEAIKKLAEILFDKRDK